MPVWYQRTAHSLPIWCLHTLLNRWLSKRALSFFIFPVPEEPPSPGRKGNTLLARISQPRTAGIFYQIILCSGGSPCASLDVCSAPGLHPQGASRHSSCPDRTCFQTLTNALWRTKSPPAVLAQNTKRKTEFSKKSKRTNHIGIKNLLETFRSFAF